MTRSIRDEREALAFVRRHLVVGLTAMGKLPALVSAVAGEPVRGSWWGHPSGALIYRLSTYLDDSPEVLTVKLVAGKVTFVHRKLWPALLRVVEDSVWRKTRMAELDDVAARLLGRVERAGELELAAVAAAEKRQSLTRARKTLESQLLVLSRQRHTASGAHATTLLTWSHWSSEIGVRASRVSMANALAEVNRATGGEPTGLALAP